MNASSPGPQSPLICRHRIFSPAAISLIELLVAIAIIAVLASLLFPMSGRISRSFKETKGINNMKQVLSTAALYTGDYRTTVFYRQVLKDGRNMYYFQYFPTEYWSNDFSPLHSPFEELPWQQKGKPVYRLLPGTQEVPIPSFGFNRNGPRALAPNLPSGSTYIRPDTAAMQEPSRRAYFIDTMGKNGAADLPGDDVANPLRYSYDGGTAALVGFMDYSVRLVKKADIQGTEGSSWTEEDRNFFWTGNPTR